MYIKYKFVDTASLLISQASRVFLLLVTVPLTTEALRLGFAFNLGFLQWSDKWPAILEVSLLALPLLKLVVLITIKIWCSFLISTMAV